MVAAKRLVMQDLPRQKRVEVELSDSGDLTFGHTVGQALDHFQNRFQIGDGSRWTAYSRGVQIDSKLRLGDLPDADASLTVMPEVSAG